LSVPSRTGVIEFMPRMLGKGGSFQISQSLEKAFLSGWLLLWNVCQWIYGAKSCSNNGRPRLWSFFI